MRVYDKYLSNKGEFKKKAKRLRQIREDRGDVSIYSRMQPFSCPNLIDLHGRQIDTLVGCKLKVMVEGKVKKETKLR